ncbi:DMT family transporter [Aestuariivirga litoralis]|uniref:DMT family transporter n=1 Tax=Aestuariivirga litoralis TaxID=2650924 RepID=UPI0018C6F436|nr:DMT family transporter [Aestuariivirga litoralis]MBG1231169.1 DMT family transporter [Aestuariivirga litoralis]
MAMSAAATPVARNKTLLSIVLLLSAMAILPMIDVIAKHLGRQGIPVPELVWARFFFGALLTLPFALRSKGRAALHPVNPLLNSLRALCLIMGTAFFFASLHYLPVADTLSIYFVQPVLIVALSPFVLKEKVDLTRWAVVFAGFIGVLIIIRPGIQEFSAGHFLALLAGLSSAFYILITRALQGRADPIITTFQTSAIGAVALTALAPTYWLPPLPQQWLLLLALGGIAILGHYFITKAYDYGEASLLSPLNYSEMVTSVILGWVFFNDFPDRYTFLGVAILIACAIYISQNERRKMAAEASEAAAHP